MVFDAVRKTHPVEKLSFKWPIEEKHNATVSSPDDLQAVSAGLRMMFHYIKLGLQQIIIFIIH